VGLPDVQPVSCPAIMFGLLTRIDIDTGASGRSPAMHHKDIRSILRTGVS
jgi:hypothetical protein